MQVKLDTSRYEWNSPARSRSALAHVESPVGRFDVIRSPAAGRSVHSSWEAWEDWELTLGGTRVLQVTDLARPGHDARLRVKAGVGVTLPEGSGRALGAGSLFAGRRHFSVAVDGHRIEFRRQGWRTVVLLNGDEVASYRLSTDWRIPEPTESLCAVIAFFTAAGLDGLLSSPLTNLL